MDLQQNTFDDTLLRTMDKLIEKENKKPKKRLMVAEKRLMYYSGWHKDDMPVTRAIGGEKQEKLIV